jgi:hypothetical protein
MAPRSLRSMCDRRTKAMFTKTSQRMTKMGDQNLLSRAPPCFGKHVKPLIPATFAVVNTPSSFKEG